MNEKQILKKLLKTQECLDPLLHNKVIDEKLYNRLLRKGSQPGKMYGVCKVHKTGFEGSPPFRPILSAIGTPTYNIAKFLISLLEPHQFVIRESFMFVQSLKKQN